LVKALVLDSSREQGSFLHKENSKVGYDAPAVIFIALPLGAYFVMPLADPKASIRGSPSRAKFDLTLSFERVHLFGLRGL
jgi:hypothetical protein